MTSQPEKLFRDKLENFQRPAPAAAWDRIEAGLQPRHRGRWMKVAAALLVLAVAAFLLWPSTPATDTQSLTKTASPVEPEKEKTNAQEVVPPVAVAQQQEKPIKTKRVKKDNPVLLEQPTTTIENNVAVAIEPEEAVPAESAIVQPEAETPSRTIVYTAEEVNARFLRKKLPDEATPEMKKTSGIQKLMGVAYNIKNTDKGFGDLRQKKDEILALNFLYNEDKTDKSKN